MYLLFGPAIAGLLVIGFIQLRDQFTMTPQEDSQRS